MPTTLSDGNKTKQFPLNPEIKVTISGEFASNQVLDTYNPQVRPKSASRVFKLDDILLYSFAGNIDQQPLITTLQYWASQQTKLKLTSDIHNCKSCYIRSLDLQVKRWDGNKVLAAEMSIELLETFIGSTSKTSASANKAAKKITPREQNKLKQNIKNKLKTPSKQRLIGLNDSNFTVEVADNKSVSITAEGQTKEYDYDDLDGRIS
jgi:hypothetical protein